MSYAYAYKAAATVPATVPDDWPDGWTFPGPPYPPGFESTHFLVVDGIGAVDDQNTSTHYSGGNPFSDMPLSGTTQRRVDFLHFPSAVARKVLGPSSLFLFTDGSSEFKATPKLTYPSNSNPKIFYGFVLEDFDPATVTYDDLTLGIPSSGPSDTAATELEIDDSNWTATEAKSQDLSGATRRRVDFGALSTTTLVYGLAISFSSLSSNIKPKVELVYDATTMPVIYLDVADL